MYHLVSGFYKLLTKKDEFNVLILGLDNAGKSTFLETAKTKFTKNYKGMNLQYITTTVGLNIGQIEMAGVRLSFWDLGGQKELQSLWDKVIPVLFSLSWRFTIFSFSTTMSLMQLFTWWTRTIESEWMNPKSFSTRWLRTKTCLAFR